MSAVAAVLAVQTYSGKWPPAECDSPAQVEHAGTDSQILADNQWVLDSVCMARAATWLRFRPCT